MGLFYAGMAGSSTGKCGAARVPEVPPIRATPVALLPGRTYILTVVQSSRFPLVEAFGPVKKNVVLFILLAASFLPAVARLAGSGLGEPVGLLSDLALGGLVFCLALAAPPWLRVGLVLFWALFQATAVELFAAMQRLPTWQDLHYLADAEFMRASTAGLKLARPVFVGLQLLAALALCLLPVRRPGSASGAGRPARAGAGEPPL